MGKCAVVKVLEQASREAWKKWRQHVANGTADSAEAAQAYEESRLAGAAWLNEVSERAARSAVRAA